MKKICLLIFVAVLSSAAICTAQMTGSKEYRDHGGTIRGGNDDGLFCDSSFGCPSLKCSIWTKKNQYTIGEKIYLYVSVSKPCYVQITINKPGKSKSIIGPRWVTSSDKFLVFAGQPDGKRDITLLAWTKSKSKKTCYSYCTYWVGQAFGYGSRHRGFQYTDLPDNPRGKALDSPPIDSSQTG